MTDKQTALLLRSVSDRITRLKDDLAFWLDDNPEATAKEMLSEVQSILYVSLQCDLDEDIRRLES